MSKKRTYGKRGRAQIMKKAVELAHGKGSLLAIADALQIPYKTMHNWYRDPQYAEWREELDEAFEEGAERLYQQMLETATKLASPEGLDVEVIEETYELPRGEYRMSRNIEPNEHGQYCTKRVVRKQKRHDPTIILRGLAKHNPAWRSDAKLAVEAGVETIVDAVKAITEGDK